MRQRERSWLLLSHRGARDISKTFLSLPQELFSRWQKFDYTLYPYLVINSSPRSFARKILSLAK